LFNEGINAFIKRYRGSRKEAGRVIGCSSVVIGQMLRGEMKVPLLRAFLIEELSKGAIPTSLLIKGQEPALAKAIEKSRHTHCQRLVKRKHYRLSKLPIMGFNEIFYFPFSHSDYLIEDDYDQPVIIINENLQLIYGSNTLEQAIQSKRNYVGVFVIDLTELLQKNYATLPIELTLIQRVIIGKTLEHIISDYQQLSVAMNDTSKSANQPPLPHADNYPIFLPVLENFINTYLNAGINLAEEISKRISLNNYANYLDIQKVLQKGIDPLKKALDTLYIDAASASEIAEMSSDKQQAALEKILHFEESFV